MSYIGMNTVADMHHPGAEIGVVLSIACRRWRRDSRAERLRARTAWLRLTQRGSPMRVWLVIQLPLGFTAVRRESLLEVRRARGQPGATITDEDDFAVDGSVM
jgi:hypothetical protein